MAYVTGNIPVGDYDPRRLANLGLGHDAIDAGGGYAYFNPQTGNEVSAVLGFTYNFMNDHTQYQSGVNAHLDWGMSKFLTKQWQVGLVGYIYNQISCDSGTGNRVGCFESRGLGAGPQIGYSFPVATCRVTSISKAMASSAPPIGRTAGTCGSLSRSRRRRPRPLRRVI
jgi:hypothetical protein